MPLNSGEIFAGFRHVLPNGSLCRALRAPPLTAPHDAVPHAEMAVRAWPPQLHNKYKRGFAPGIGCRRKTTPWSMPARFTWIAAESAATPTIVLHIGTFPLEECPHPKVLGVELIRSNLEILRRRHK